MYQISGDKLKVASLIPLCQWVNLEVVSLPDVFVRILNSIFIIDEFITCDEIFLIKGKSYSCKYDELTYFCTFGALNSLHE